MLVVFADDLLPMLFLAMVRWPNSCSFRLGWFLFQPVDKGAIIVGQMRYIILWQISRLLALATLFCCIYLYNIDYVFLATGFSIYAMSINLAWHEISKQCLHGRPR